MPTCCTADERAWIEARITKTKQMIESYEDAILALSSGAQSYTLDTGQTRQTVTRSQLATLKNVLESLENRLSMLQARLCGGRATRMVPGF